MKNHSIIRYLIFILFFTFSCCREKNNPVCPEFTEDELSWINLKGDTVELNDTSEFKMIPISSIDRSPFYEYNGNFITGTVHICYENAPFVLGNLFVEGSVDIKKYTDNSFIVENISINGHYHDWASSPSAATIDTALINGKLYNEVYKWNIIPEDSTDFKTVFFARDYGFLKIEYNGNKIELIP